MSKKNFFIISNFKQDKDMVFFDLWKVLLVFLWNRLRFDIENQEIKTNATLIPQGYY